MWCLQQLRRCVQCCCSKPGEWPCTTSVSKINFFAVMNILDTIIAQKRIEVAQQKKEVPVAVLEQYDLFKKLPYSLKAFIKDGSKSGIIAEFKRASPSKGIINSVAKVEEVTAAYTR